MGIPYSHWLGGPNRWTDHDRDLALAYRREMALRCNQCNTRQDEWDANPNAYVGHIRICPGCARLEDEQDNVPKGTRGVHTSLVPEEVGLAEAEALGDMDRPTMTDGDDGNA